MCFRLLVGPQFGYQVQHASSVVCVPWFGVNPFGFARDLFVLRTFFVRGYVYVCLCAFLGFAYAPEGIREVSGRPWGQSWMAARFKGRVSEQGTEHQVDEVWRQNENEATNKFDAKKGKRITKKTKFEKTRNTNATKINLFRCYARRQQYRLLAWCGVKFSIMT